MTLIAEPTVPEALRSIVDRPRQPPARPFRSLDPLRFADAGLLTARDREVEQLVRLVTMYRGVLLYGESGSGKSSVINAGVLPRLLRDGYWPHRVRIRALAGQEFALEPVVCSDTDGELELPSAFAGAEFGAGQFVDAVATATGRGPILLVFDQFEELVTLFPRRPELSDQQRAIIDAIVTLVRGRRHAELSPEDVTQPPVIRVKVLLGFREDYLASLKPLLERRPELIHQGIRLSRPPLSCAPDIIRAPFERFPDAFRPDLSPLADRITAALGEGNKSGETPLSELQIVCNRLYGSADPAADLDRGVTALLEDHLKDALAKFTRPEHAAAIAVLGTLVTSSGTRNVVARETLVADAERDTDRPLGVVEAAVTKLEHESGLIRREQRGDIELFELTSEFLIKWISGQRRRLEADRARRRARAVQRRIAVLALAAVVIVALAVAAYESQQSASRDRALNRADQLEATAQNLLDTEPDAALELALQAYRENPGSAAVRASLTSALEQAALSPAGAILHGSLSAVTSVAFDPRDPNLLAAATAGGGLRLWDARTNRAISVIAPLPSGVFSVAFSPDGHTLAAGSADGHVRLYSVTARGLAPAGEPIRAQPGIVVGVAFSPDGRLLATAGLDAGVTLVPLSGGAPVANVDVIPLGPGGPARGLAFAPNSDDLAVVTNDGWIYVWDALAHRRIAALRPGGGAALYAVTFLGGSTAVAAGGLHGQLYLWSIAAPQRLVQLGAPGSPIDGVAFDQRRTMLAVARTSTTLQLFDLGNSAAAPVPLAGHEGVVTAVAFAPDGRTLASASTDQTVRLWPIPPVHQFGQALPGTVGPIDAAAYSPQGTFLVAAGERGVDRWRVLSDGAPVGQPSRLWTAPNVRAVGVSAHDGTIAAATQHGRLALWYGSGALMRIVTTDRTPIYTVAFDPVAPELAFAGKDGLIWVMSYPGGRPHVFGRRTDRIFSLAFSPDGRLLATAGDDRVIRLWKRATGAEIGQMAGDSDAIFAIAFSPNRRWLASGSADDTVRTWSVRSAREHGLPLLGHRDFVRSVAFGPDSKLLVSGSFDGTVRLWEVSSGAAIGQPLAAGGRAIQTVALSPNGQYVIGSGDDGTIRVWPQFSVRSYGVMRERVCRLIGSGLSRAEWSQFAPAGFRYENPCS